MLWAGWAGYWGAMQSLPVTYDLGQRDEFGGSLVPIGLLHGPRAFNLDVKLFASPLDGKLGM
jgi:hypothetical protein